MSNQIVKTAKELLLIEADLPHRFSYNGKQRPTVDDFQMYVFEQSWGSTALGFGGIGGQAITSARTYVFIPIDCDQKCFVYFAGKFAYSVDYCEAFMKDVLDGHVESISGSSKYI